MASLVLLLLLLFISSTSGFIASLEAYFNVGEEQEPADVLFIPLMSIFVDLGREREGEDAGSV